MQWTLRLALSRLMNNRQLAWHEAVKSEGMDIGRGWIEQCSGGVSHRTFAVK